ncbi:hypothetical protein SCG7086_AA_00730 [Chlamydiales bacterium SCGC AG-110-P3]|nr:hypothetical protein SCG7086_AA_00730 [Chlamydiales bacterium SCGC AG-110-P3]
MTGKVIRIYLLLSISLLLGGSCSVFAATLELDSGDRLHGAVVSSDASTLILDHPHFGEMVIAADRIVAFDEESVSDDIRSDISYGGACDDCGDFSSDDSSDVQHEAPYDEYEPDCVDPVCVVPWSGKGSAGFSDKTGNSVTQTLAVSVEATRKKLWNGRPWTRWETEAKYDYEEEEGEDTVSKGRAKLEYERRVARRIALRAEEEVSFNQRKGLRYRLATTGGLGYYLFDDDCFTLELLVGLAQVEAHYSDRSNNERSLNVPMGWEVKWVFCGDASISYEFQFSPDVEEFDRYRLYNDIELSIPISGCWSYNIEYEYIYLSRPATGKDHYDGVLKMKLCLKF